MCSLPGRKIIHLNLKCHIFEIFLNLDCKLWEIVSYMAQLAWKVDLPKESA